MTAVASAGEVPDPTPTRRVSRLHIAAGVAVSALFLLLAVRGASLSGVRDALRATRPLPVVIGLASGLAMCGVMGLRWRAVMQTTTPISVKDAVDQVTIANLAGLVLPARFGDVARVLLVQTRWSVPTSHALGAIVFERLSDVVILMALAGSIATVVVLPVAIRVGLLTIGGAAGAALLLLWLLAWRGTRLAEPLLARLPIRLAEAVGTRLPRVVESLQLIRRPRQLLVVVGLSALIWTLSGLMLVSFVFASRLQVPWYAGFMVLMLVNLGGVLPSSPGGIGVYHYLSILALSFWTTDRSAALSFAALSHALALLVTAVAGFHGLARQGLSLRTFARRITNAEAFE